MFTQVACLGVGDRFGVLKMCSLLAYQNVFGNHSCSPAAVAASQLQASLLSEIPIRLGGQMGKLIIISLSAAESGKQVRCHAVLVLISHRPSLFLGHELT